jgi:hypothetical protein
MNQMNEWRDRGYVPDSDDEEIILDDDTINTLSQVTTTPTPRRASVELVSDILAEDGACKSSRESLAENEKELRKDKQLLLPQASTSLDTPHRRQEPVILIVQARKEPEDTSKTITTYSRKFKPGALKRIKSLVNSKDHGIQQERHVDETVEDDEFIDIDEIVGTTTSRVVVPAPSERRSSVSSSDLSDVDMRVLSSPQPLYGQPPSTARTAASTPLAESHTSATNLDASINSLSDHQLAALSAEQPRRNLRTRKAIQLHPYMIEIEQYRRSLKARGLRPIQVATNSQRPREQDDSQDAEFQQDENQPLHRNTSHTQETTPPDSSTSSDLQHNSLRNLTVGVDEEFPDIETAMRRYINGGIQEGHKRRKTLETPHVGRRAPRLPTSTSGARGKLKSLNLTRTSSGIARPLNQDLLPPSPPRTSSPPNVNPTPAAPPRFRLPRRLSPTTAPASLPSSPERAASTSVRRSRHIVLSSDDETLRLNDAAPDQSSSTESDPDERQMMRMRRKIRGVLPASYLRLDRQNPPPSTSVFEAQVVTPTATAPVRGVAQRRATSGSTTLNRQDSRVVFSDNSESDSSLEEVGAPRMFQTRLPSPFTRSLPDQRLETAEVEEHDEIDAMFPSAGRPHFRLPGSKKRQSRVTDMFPTQHGRPASSTSDRRPVVFDNRAAHKTASNPQPRTKEKRKSRAKKPVQLSILDVNNDATSPLPRAALKPQFVRLAARQARKRPDQGRQSPTHKNIRLATREDTHEALEPLRSWTSGNLTRTWNPPPPRRVHRGVDILEPPTSGPPAPSEVGDNAPAHSPATRTNLQPDLLLSTRPVQSRLIRRPDNRRQGRNTTRTLQPDRRVMFERNHRMRPAQLESVIQDGHQYSDPVAFGAPPSRLMDIFARDRGAQPASRYRLERFLQDRDDMPEVALSSRAEQPQQDTNVTGKDRAPIKQRTRKRTAQRFDVETTKFRQPDEPLPAEDSYLPTAETGSETTHVPIIDETLQGLGVFGARYPTDFDVRPLEIGTYFAASTFIGSGDFNDCLTLRDRDLDLPAGRITVEAGGRSLQWSAWNEDVSVGLGLILSTCTKDLHAAGEFEGDEMRRNSIEETNVRFNYFLRSIVRYLSGCIHYLDPIDRSSSLTRISRFVDEFLDMLEGETTLFRSHADVKTQIDRLVVDSLLYLLCMTAQSVRISSNPALDPRTQVALLEKCVQLSKRVLLTALPLRLTPIREFLESHRQYNQRDSGIQERDIAVKSIVILNHVLTSTKASSSLAGILSSQLGQAIGKTFNIHSLDQIWYDAFCVQPLLEIDARGIYIPKSRFDMFNDNWTLIKSLLQRTFELYPSTSKVRSATLNDYVRACLVRVYHLITRWGWRRCDIALGTIYDFFAKNNLRQLHREEGHGSPRFLEDLDKNPAIELEPRDCAFHVFLKLLVVGLRGLQEVYPKNKVRGFAWRFIPNHGRTYRKDQELTHADLDALRNHHDLLCTLYWILPSGCGPRLQMIRDLVDHDTSHREACRLGVHAWGILARYQLSQLESFIDSDVLASWFRDMINSTTSQYRLARTDAESQFTLERARGSTTITPELLEAIITTNQRSVFATLQDLLLSMRNAIKICASWPVVRSVFEQSNVIEVLRLFDIAHPRLSIAIVQTLQIVEELLTVKSRLCKTTQNDSQPGSDDSQDYGDWTFMDQVVEKEAITPEQRHSEVAFLQEPLAVLLSTCFGSEKSPDDELLKKLVDVWTATAHQLIKDDTTDWSNFLDTYSSSSWFQLRDTEQKHKYTCYFLASVIKSDKTSLDSHRSMFLSAWFVSLLEREAMLKFQHLLTTSLLENANMEPLLHNLPFASNAQTGQYRISTTEFRERRVSLIGSVLSNMHTSLSSFNPSTASEKRREYAEMLQKGMQFMRTTYEQLQDMSSRLEGSSFLEVRGSYVTFVQQVVSLMQQYTSDIRPMDPFFVDSTAFPLPSGDPTYVIARLKSYVPKLGDGRARKELAVFVQTVSERAAAENQQPYLVGQIHQALTGSSSRLLRQVMFEAILPAYISTVNSSWSNWMLAEPLIESSAMVIEDLIYDLGVQDANAVDANIGAIHSLFAATHGWAVSIELDVLVANAGYMRLLFSIFNLVEQSLTLIDYVHRATGKARNVLLLIRNFRILGDFVSAQLNNNDEEDFLDQLNDHIETTPALTRVACTWQDTLDFATRNLAHSVSRGWQDGTRGIQVQSVEIEGMRLLAGIEMFKRCYGVIFLGCTEWGGVDSCVYDGVEEDVEGQRERLDVTLKSLRGLGWGSLL